MCSVVADNATSRSGENIEHVRQDMSETSTRKHAAHLGLSNHSKLGVVGLFPTGWRSMLTSFRHNHCFASNVSWISHIEIWRYHLATELNLSQISFCGATSKARFISIVHNLLLL